MIATIRRAVDGYPGLVFLLCLHDRVQVMDPEGFREWMQQQTWPLRENDPTPMVLPPDSQDGGWLAVSFLCENVRGGLLVVAYSRHLALFDTEGNPLQIIQPHDASTA